MVLMFIREDPLISLNYAVFLLNTDDRTGAAKLLRLYNSNLRNHKPANPDPEVCHSSI